MFLLTPPLDLNRPIDLPDKPGEQRRPTLQEKRQRLEAYIALQRERMREENPLEEDLVPLIHLPVELDLGDLPLQGIDLRSVVVRGLNFRNVDLTGADCRGAEFHFVSFVGATLIGANFGEAVLRYCSFLGDDDDMPANLQRINLQNATVIYTSFAGVNLEEAILCGIRTPTVEEQKRLGMEGPSTLNFDDANLRQANLSNSSFEGASFQRVNLEEADLHDSTFTLCVFHDAQLVKADLRRAKFIGEKDLYYFDRLDLASANCQGADFTYMRLSYHRLAGAQLKEACFKEVDFIGVELPSQKEASLKGKNFAQCKFEDCCFFDSLEGANFQESKMERVSILASYEGVDFGDSELTHVSFCGVNGKGAIFKRAIFKACAFKHVDVGLDVGFPEDRINLRGTVFRDARVEALEGVDPSLSFSWVDLTDADFTNAEMPRTSFEEARLERACFNDTVLPNANFQFAEAAGASFVNASLIQADFEGADVTGADFRDANLENANLEDVEGLIEKVKPLEGGSFQKSPLHNLQMIPGDQKNHLRDLFK